MSQSVIITCAPTGGIHTPTMSEYLPITPNDIAKASIEAAEAGASIIHLHARDPETGRPDPSPKRFMEFLPRIKQSTDAVINISTGGSPDMDIEDRLSAALETSPEMASLNMGSMNFGLFPLMDKYKEWKFDWEREHIEGSRDRIFPNTFKTIEFALTELGQKHGTKFEFECYDLGHLYNVRHFVDRGLIKGPFFIQMVFGILGGMGADLDNLGFLHKKAQEMFGDQYEWSVLAAGRAQMPFATQAALFGGNLRVGLEDNLYIGKGELAVSNAQQVRKIKAIVEELGLTVATPDEARDRLGLKGADKVGF